MSEIIFLIEAPGKVIVRHPWPRFSVWSWECLEQARPARFLLDHGTHLDVTVMNGWARYRKVGEHQLEMRSVYELEDSAFQEFA